MRRRRIHIPKEHRDADHVVGDRRDVGLGVSGEVHFDVRAPRAHRVMPAKPEARTMTRLELDAERAPDRGPKAVRGDEPTPTKAVGRERPRLRPGRRCQSCFRENALRLHRAVEQRIGERRAAHAQADADRKVAECLARGIARERIPNTDERTARRPHAKATQRFDAARHDSFAARFVDRLSGVRIHDHHREARLRSLNRGAESRGAAACDDDVVEFTHHCAAGSIDWSAASSVRMRTERSHAFNAVKTSAVITPNE